MSQYVLSNFLYWTQHAVIESCFYQRLLEEASVVHWKHFSARNDILSISSMPYIYYTKIPLDKTTTD